MAVTKPANNWSASHHELRPCGFDPKAPPTKQKNGGSFGSQHGAHMKTRARLYRVLVVLFCGVGLMLVSGCETLPDGSYGIPEGTVIYSPGDPDALFGR